MEETNNDLPAWLTKLEFLKRTSITRVTIILGGEFSGWTVAYRGGIWNALLTTGFISFAYLVLSFCLAEMTSALPFSGGIYGFARAFTTPLFGFMVAIFELLVSVFYIAPTVFLLASLPIRAQLQDESLHLVNCLIIYIIILSILLIGGKLFWLMNTLLGSILVILTFVYLLGSAPNCNFDEWAFKVKDLNFSMAVHSLPYVSTIFLGIQFLPLTSKCAKDPRKDIPIAMMCVTPFILLCGLAILLTVASQYPGPQHSIDGYFPLIFGFMHIFQLPFNSALFLYLPALFATAFGFLFCFGRQAMCMSKSGLLPEIFQSTIPFFDTPYISLLLGAFLSFLLNIINYFDPQIDHDLYLISSACSFLVFISAMISYINFHAKYSTLQRYFASPLDTKGAYLGIAIFLFCYIATVAFQGTNITAFIFTIVIGILAFLYFCLFMAKNQSFSEEEKEALFKAYLINANVQAKNRLLKKKGHVVPLGNSKNLSANKKSSNDPSKTFSQMKTGLESTARNSVSVVTGKQSESATPHRDLEANHEQKSSHDRAFVVGKDNSDEIRPVEGIDHRTEIQQHGQEQPNQLLNMPHHHHLHQSHPPPVQHPHHHHPHHPRGEVGDEGLSFSTKSFSEKIVEFLSAKFNQIVPEEDPTVHELAILQEGGIFTDDLEENDDGATTNSPENATPSPHLTVMMANADGVPV